MNLNFYFLNFKFFGFIEVAGVELEPPTLGDLEPEPPKGRLLRNIAYGTVP